MMNIKQIGDYLEVECCNCGECLLVGEGDNVNVRVEKTIDNDGEEVNFPNGFLCFVCHKEEGNLEQNFVRVGRKKCCSCGKSCETESADNFYPKFKKNGEFDGFYCSDCF